ncbi:MAG: hypothetical protein QXP58_05245 [Thermoprotei archaeon]
MWGKPKRKSGWGRRVLADGACDSKADFNFLAPRGIRPVIVCQWSVSTCQGSYARKFAWWGRVILTVGVV